MSFLAAILGLALLILIHEAGHFFAARAVGMKPRKFYIGFPPPLVRKVRNGIEYGIGAIPLGGYVKIPGMSRPEPGAFAAMLSDAQRTEHADAAARLDRALREGDEDAARAVLRDLEPALGTTRAWQELDMALAPDAYWKQHTWRRLVAIGAGPGVNLLFAALMFAGLFMVGLEQNTRTVAKVQPHSPAQLIGLHAQDVVVRIAGQPVPDPDKMPDQITRTHGRPFTLVVRRDGHRVVLGPVRAKEGTDGRYRIGFGIQSRLGPGYSPPRALLEGAKLTWFSVRDTVVGMARVISGRETQNVSSSVGIVRVSAAAWRDGLRTFLGILGSISLALGVLNLIPVLPLDGGHIVIALVEKLRGRTFSQGVYVRYSLVGFGLFAVLMYIGLRNDLFGS